VGRRAVKECESRRPVSEGKLDTSVNGPADDALCWDAIDWRFHEDNVRRLRKRIFTAARDGTWASSGTCNCNPGPSLGSLELLAVKAARAVLRGPRRSNAPGLPDW
jgi:hypothetical protein